MADAQFGEEVVAGGPDKPRSQKTRLLHSVVLIVGDLITQSVQLFVFRSY